MQSLKLILGLALIASGNVVAWGQDNSPGDYESNVGNNTRNASPFVLPTGNGAEQPGDYVAPDNYRAPGGMSVEPAAQAAPRSSYDPHATQPDQKPFPVVDSHPLPGAAMPRSPLSLPPPPTSYGSEENMPTYGSEGNMPSATIPEMPAAGPVGNHSAMLPLPPPDTAQKGDEIHSAYYEQGPGNQGKSTEIQPVAGSSAPLASAPAIKVEPSPLPLAPPTSKDRTLKPTEPVSNSRMVATVMASLTAVIGLFLVVAWGTRKALPKGAGRLPTEVVEQLGRLPLAGKTELQLIRLGSKLVLISSTAGSMEAVSEVTDPLEVERLLVMCRGNKPGSSSAAFRETLAQVAAEPARGFAGEFARANPTINRRA